MLIVALWLILGFDAGICVHIRGFSHFHVTCGTSPWLSLIYLGNRRGSTILRGALEGVLFLNLRNGLKGVLLLNRMRLI